MKRSFKLFLLALALQSCQKEENVVKNFLSATVNGISLESPQRLVGAQMTFNDEVNGHDLDFHESTDEVLFDGIMYNLAITPDNAGGNMSLPIAGAEQ